MRLVFMGTPDFAVPSLDILLRNDYDIAAVITAPDKPAGRGNKLMPSPIKNYALEHNLPLLQPEKLRDAQFIAQLQALHADLQVVVAFRMLPAVVFTMPPLGCINLHASLLPQYRGAAPINWAIINGDTETGLSTFYIEQDIDTGKILQQTHLSIGENETAGELHDRMMQAGAQLLLDTVNNIKNGTTRAFAQPHIPDMRPAPKIFSETCQINWAQPAPKIHHFVRGLSPYPGAYGYLNGQSIKILRTSIPATTASNTANDAVIGTIVSDHKKSLQVLTAQGMLNIEQLQMPGKRPMNISDFLNGYRQPLIRFD
jgi:methionyl-tRNA formyltransferase